MLKSCCKIILYQKVISTYSFIESVGENPPTRIRLEDREWKMKGVASLKFKHEKQIELDLIIYESILLSTKKLYQKSAFKS